MTTPEPTARADGPGGSPYRECPGRIIVAGWMHPLCGRRASAGRPPASPCWCWQRTRSARPWSWRRRRAARVRPSLGPAGTQHGGQFRDRGRASGAYHGGRRGRPRRRRHLAGADPQAGCGAVPGRGGRGCGGQPRRPAAAVTGTRPGCGGGLDSCRWLPSHVQSRGRGHPRRSGQRARGDAGRWTARRTATPGRRFLRRGTLRRC